MKIRRGDMVVITTGNDSGITPHKVVQVVDDGNKLVIEGVNRVTKHVRRGHPKSPQGGHLQIEKPIASSNVQFYCSSCTKGAKLGYRYADDGSKERFCRKCKTTIDTISPARPRYAKS